MFVAGAVVVVEVDFGQAAAEDAEGFGQGVFESGIAEVFAELFAGGTVEMGVVGGQRPVDVGVAGVEAEPYAVEMADAGDFNEAGRGSEVVVEVFEQELDAERGGEGLEVLDGGEGEVEGFGGPAVVLKAEVEDAGAEGNLLGGFEGAFDLVHGFNALALGTADEVQGGLGVTAPVDLVLCGEERHVHGGSDGIGAKPGADLPHRAAVGVVELVPRGEDFDRLGPGLAQGVEGAGGETVGKEEVAGDAEGHASRVSRCGGGVVVCG